MYNISLWNVVEKLKYQFLKSELEQTNVLKLKSRGVLIIQIISCSGEKHVIGKITVHYYTFCIHLQVYFKFCSILTNCSNTQDMYWYCMMYISEYLLIVVDWLFKQCYKDKQTKYSRSLMQRAVTSMLSCCWPSWTECVRPSC